MKELCRSCNVCVGLGVPEQTDVRNLSFKVGKVTDEAPTILVIDDHFGEKEIPLTILEDIFPKGVVYSYTHTIRCTFGFLEGEQWAGIVGRCSVWTNLLIPDRQIILTTSTGMRQMGINSAPWEDGKIYNSPAHGLILCISPLKDLPGVKVEKYRVQVERMIKSINMGEKV